jgi:hypothetical protein
MPKTDFVPKRDGDLDAYELNFLNKLTFHSSTLGIDPAEVANINSKVNSHRMSFANVISKRAESKSANEDNVFKKRNAVNDFRRAAKLVKSLSNYTNAIGDDLQIIGPDKPLKSTDDLKPSLAAKVNGQEVLIRFVKEYTDGIRIFTRRGDETEFTFLVLTTQSPYVDKRPKLISSKPEQREYYAVFFEDIHDVGNQSDVIKVTIS